MPKKLTVDQAYDKVVALFDALVLEEQDELFERLQDAFGTAESDADTDATA